MMRRALLLSTVLATTITTTRGALRRGRALASALASAPAEGSPQDEYVRHWAHEGKSRCGAPNCRWMREFGPIDVGCRIEIDRVGLADGGTRPRFTLVFTDGRSTETIDARGAPSVQNFVTRPALCEYVVRAAQDHIRRRAAHGGERTVVSVQNVGPVPQQAPMGRRRGPPTHALARRSARLSSTATASCWGPWSTAWPTTGRCRVLPKGRSGASSLAAASRPTSYLTVTRRNGSYAAYYVGYAGLSTFDRTLVDIRATHDQWDARLARPDNCTFTVGKNTQRGVAGHVPNAPAGVYMRHFRSLP